VDCATIVDGVPAVIDLDVRERVRSLKHGDRRLDVNYPFRASAIEYDQRLGCFFVADGTAVYQIEGSELNGGQVLVPGCGPMLRSAITILPDAVVLGNRRNLFFWPRDGLMSHMHNTSVGPSGRVVTDLPGVTSLVNGNRVLMAASRNHHAIHVFSEDGNLSRCCMGHAGAVTCLCTAGEGTFMSGSTDLTARMWDLRAHKPVAQLQRHLAPLTCIGRVIDNQMFLTGGEDHVVRCWDIKMGRTLFEVNVGQGIPIAVDCRGVAGPGGWSLTVVTKEKESTCGQGYQIGKNDNGGHTPASMSLVVEMCPNMAVRFNNVLAPAYQY
jgi:hypothetical protein